TEPLKLSTLLGCQCHGGPSKEKPARSLPLALARRPVLLDRHQGAAPSSGDGAPVRSAVLRWPGAPAEQTTARAGAAGPGSGPLGVGRAVGRIAEAGNSVVRSIPLPGWSEAKSGSRIPLRSMRATFDSLRRITV